MEIPNKYVIVVVIFAFSFDAALGSKIPHCYFSDQQFLAFLTFLATANWLSYVKHMYISPAKKELFDGRIVKASD